MIFGFFAVVGKAGVDAKIVVEGGADECSEGDSFVGGAEDDVKGDFAIFADSAIGARWRR